MKRYKVTLMVPHSTTIEAMSKKQAESEALRMVNRSRAVEENEPTARLFMIECVGETQEDFNFPPPAA